MSDIVTRLRVKVDLLHDRVFELQQEKETLLERNARLTLMVEDLQAVRRTARLTRYDSTRPCGGCGCHPDRSTYGCRQCSWRHSKRRRRNLELVA